MPSICHLLDASGLACCLVASLLLLPSEGKWTSDRVRQGVLQSGSVKLLAVLGPMVVTADSPRKTVHIDALKASEQGIPFKYDKTRFWIPIYFQRGECVPEVV